MRYEMRVTAYDVLDHVQVALVLWEMNEDPDTPNEPRVRSVTTVQGTGESDPYRWAIDALVAALETL